MSGVDTCVHPSMMDQVAVKVPPVVHDPCGELYSKAEKHANAWDELKYVLLPFGFLFAHEPTGTPAALVTQMGIPLDTFLAHAGPLAARHINRIKAITRVVFQLLQFILSAYGINFLHMDIQMKNMFIVQSHSLELVKLAVGNFGRAQRGEEREATLTHLYEDKCNICPPCIHVFNAASFITRGNDTVLYRTSVDTSDHTSLRMISAIQNGITAPVGAASRTVLLDSQLCFFNDLHGWARIAVPALVDRPPPNQMCGPIAEDYAMVPQLGFGNVLDAVHHMMHFALGLLTPGRIEGYVDSEYITSLEWYDTLPEILAGELGHNGAAATAPNGLG